MKLYGLEFLTQNAGQPEEKLKAWLMQSPNGKMFLNPDKFLQKKALLTYTGQTKSKVLILAGDSVSAGWLCEHLKKQKISFIAVNFDEFIFSGRVSYTDKTGACLHYGKQTVRLDGTSKVFYAPPRSLQVLDAHPETLSVEEKILLSRWKTFLHDLEMFVPLEKWIPTKPRELYESSQQKLSDIILAKELGIKTPETIVTMEPQEAKRFVIKHKGQVIFRDFSTRRVRTKNNIQTFKIDFVKPNSKTWKFIAASPTVLQQYIDKETEFRVVMVGKTCFACEIDSQSGVKSKKDWRAYEFDKVSFKKGALPINLQKKLSAFAKLRGFKLCTFDLIKDHKGDYYFLEMNRPGSWLFVEALTGLPITDAIIKLFSKD